MFYMPYICLSQAAICVGGVCCWESGWGGVDTGESFATLLGRL